MAGAAPANADRTQATLYLDSPITSAKGVTEARAKALRKLNITTVRDLLTHFPRRYMDLTNVCTVASARIGEVCTIPCEIFEVRTKRPRPNLPIVEVTLVDGTDTMVATFFHMPWIAKKLRRGMRLAVSGKLAFDFGFKRMTNPLYEEISGAEVEGRIIAIHPATEMLQAGHIRRIIGDALDAASGMHDPIPPRLLASRGLISRGAAFRAMHEPRSMDEVQVARTRLVYDELLLLQLYLMQLGSREVEGATPKAHETEGSIIDALRHAMPFTLTEDQEHAISELFDQMREPHVADHMVLGDVGSGKTVVSAFGVAAAKQTGTQAAIMAPTEILAQQHMKTLGPLFAKAGISAALLTGSTPHEERMQILRDLGSGALDVIIGTHALIEDDVAFKELTFVTIDEQQRFGVGQRAALLDKGVAPDALYMTATPIPRSLALTLFGNLTHSYMRQKPNAGASRMTRAYSREQKGSAYDAARAAVMRGEQVYVVCPLIGSAKADAKRSPGDEDEPYYPDVMIEDDSDLTAEGGASAVKEAKRLSTTVFADANVGLLHGGMRPEEKQRIMEGFASGEVQVLVTTTVIEVGVDVPNATVMIVEDADRFGLSQLHQLRGRVGRGEKDANVYLISSSKQPAAMQRLSALEQSDDGFQIAAYDLSLRREGDILGNKQSGAGSLKLVNIVKDAELIDAAHADARALLADDPSLSSAEVSALAREVRMTFMDERQVSGG
ncbi:MAG: ATP-dependent DNA helicase RecG [Eggerthellaceae bacterium]|nr:ATP-dependent DNA helicase RecG [Eggerthellaceae bacterium]